MIGNIAEPPAASRLNREDYNMSWKPEVIVNGESNWVGNALRFATKEEAEANVKQLAWNWTSVRETRVVESVDPVNYRFVDGKLVDIENVVDLKVRNEGTIYLLTPCTDAGRDWVKEHIPEDAIRWSKESVVIEHRFIEDIVNGAINDGLEVS